MRVKKERRAEQRDEQGREDVSSLHPMPIYRYDVHHNAMALMSAMVAIVASRINLGNLKVLQLPGYR